MNEESPLKKHRFQKTSFGSLDISELKQSESLDNSKLKQSESLDNSESKQSESLDDSKFTEFIIACNLIDFAQKEKRSEYFPDLVITGAEGIPIYFHKLFCMCSPVLKAMFKHQMEESLSGKLYLPESTYSIIVLCNLLYRGHDTTNLLLNPLFQYKLQPEIVRMVYRLELNHVKKVRKLLNLSFLSTSCDGEVVNELYTLEPSMYSPVNFFKKRKPIVTFTNVDKISNEFWDGCIQQLGIDIWSFAANVLRFHVFSRELLKDSLTTVISFDSNETNNPNYKIVMTSDGGSLLAFLQYITHSKIRFIA